jgi:hypothetical protein
MSKETTFDPKLITEQQFLTGDEKRILKWIRNKRVGFILSAYGSLAYVFVEMWGPISFKDVILILTRAKFITYFFGALFLLLTIFFIKYFLKSAYPYMKDVKEGIKNIISFSPGKYKTPFFEDYYLETPIKKIALIKINKDLYDALEYSQTATIHISPHAKFVFYIEIAGKQIKFDGSHWLADM